MSKDPNKDVKFRPSGTVRLANPAPGGRGQRRPSANPAHGSQPQKSSGRKWSVRAALSSLWPHPVTLICAFLLVILLISLAIDIALHPIGPSVRGHPRISLDLAVFVEAGAALLALAVMAKFVEHRGLASVGFDRTRAARQIEAGALIGGVIALATMWLMSTSDDYVLNGPHQHLSPWMPLCVCLAYAIANEVIFRGYIFRIMEYRYGSLIGLLAMAAISTALHVAASGASIAAMPHEIVGEAIAAGSTGLLLAAAYMATRRLWMSISIQWVWSFVAGPILGMNLTGLGIDTDSWCRPSIQGGILGGGADVGPMATIAGGLVWTVAAAAVLSYAVHAKQWKPTRSWQPIVRARKTGG
jgi:membrane protease YdiL (CAAX protease family)